MSSFGIVTAILPILIIGTLIGTVFLMFKIRSRFMTVKLTYWLLSIYAVLLLVATAAAPFVTKEVEADEKVAQSEHDEMMSDLYTKLGSGRVSEIDPKHLKQENHFDDFDGNELTISLSEGMDGSQIYVDKKKKNDRTVEFYIFGTELLVDDMDFSQHVQPSRVELSGSHMTISAVQQKVTISIASESFPVRQRTGKPFMDHSISSGGQILYLIIPEDVKVNAGENVYLQYVND
ncbi:hypothetical protein WQ57_19825 [Mesobacillus campisalis]|uniref:Uncharacterized protein n=1 Tax=Mesobacillus campisalis TaxID=1408103 RepID=A0A0M2SRP5_9BACI|nr:hypothetical protein [Mesobacillus campisalis]KKK36336.1 hypothetical protein WQ57_19825 [Mesobacillus campisalis]